MKEKNINTNSRHRSGQGFFYTLYTIQQLTTGKTGHHDDENDDDDDYDDDEYDVGDDDDGEDDKPTH